MKKEKKMRSPRDLWRDIKPRVQFFDIFGKQVSLTVKGGERYHSLFSIMVSLLFFLVMFTTAIYLLIDYWVNPIRSLSNRSLTDISQDDQFKHSIDLFSANLQLGFGFLNEMPAGIGRVTAEYWHYQRSGSEMIKQTKTYLSLQKCGDVYQRAHFKNLFCFADDDKKRLLSGEFGPKISTTSRFLLEFARRMSLAAKRIKIKLHGLKKTLSS